MKMKLTELIENAIFAIQEKEEKTENRRLREKINIAVDALNNLLVELKEK